MLADVMPEITRPTNSHHKRRRQRHQHVVRGEPEVRQQHHRPPSEAIRQAADHRREQELHQRPDGAEQAEDARGACGVVADEAFDQLRQHRNDDAERQHVEQDGDEDEGDRRAARRATLRRRPPSLPAHDSRFLLCAKGLAFSRKRNPHRRARQVEGLAQRIGEIAQIGLRDGVGARAEQHEARRPRLGLRDVVQLQPPARYRRRRIGRDRLLEPAIERRRSATRLFQTA